METVADTSALTIVAARLFCTVMPVVCSETRKSDAVTACMLKLSDCLSEGGLRTGPKLNSATYPLGNYYT